MALYSGRLYSGKLYLGSIFNQDIAVDEEKPKGVSGKSRFVAYYVQDLDKLKDAESSHVAVNKGLSGTNASLDTDINFEQQVVLSIDAHSIDNSVLAVLAKRRNIILTATLLLCQMKRN